ncbi:MAG: hypothetical protein KGV59_04255 [Tenacibaculum sp.]|nr:hypothetical protein [Tenacibaculum sp.]
MEKKSIFLKLLSLILLFTINNKIFAQLDNPDNNTDNSFIGTLKVPVEKIKKPKSLDFDNDAGFKTANKKLQEKNRRKQEEENLKNKGIILPEMIAKENYKKNFEGKFPNFPIVDMDLGSFHTNSKYIYISSYDFGRFDGDKVQIAMNGKVHYHEFLLSPRIKTIKIPLEKGINRLEVTAINEGKLTPNTGYFAFFDDNKYVIKEGEWMLAKDAKVIAIIVKK